jgi:predicted esterase
MTREDRESEIADYVEYLDALHGEIVARSGGHGVRVNVIGFSQGAATATRWVMHGHARLDRLVLWGGLIPPEASLVNGIASLRHVPLTIVRGKRDHYVTAEMLAAERARLETSGIPHEVIEFDGGHVVSRSVFPRLVAGDGSV